MLLMFSTLLHRLTNWTGLNAPDALLAGDGVLEALS